jgi:hypothetical protein
MKVFSLSAPLLTLYLLACALISAFALSSFASVIQEYLSVEYSFGTELFMVMGQVAFQWLFMFSESWTARKDYMVVALSVSMVGSLMLLPLILFHSMNGISPSLAVTYFFAVVAAIFVIHFHLIKKLLLPKVLTITWVVYRLFLLIYVLFPRTIK